MQVHLEELAARQADIVAAWQLAAAGWSPDRIRHRRKAWRSVHSGVYALTHAPLTRRQWWFAATLTTPESVLSHASAAACWGFREFDGAFETITRPGSGGRRRMPRLLVSHSTTLTADVTRRDGIQITTGARTLIDLVPHLHERAARRAFREALRLRSTTRAELSATLDRRRGTKLLADLVQRYGAIPYARTRSDAEGHALEVLLDAGAPLPEVNVPVAGEEADLVYRDRRVILEIDGPQYHRFREEDERRQRRWEAAGYTVHRLPSDVVYEQPAVLLAAALRGGGAQR